MIGWKIELFMKEQVNRNLSGEILLKSNKKRYHALKEIYSGQKLDKKKKDALLNGKKIEDSGVAEYILLKL